jgi:hypothetical protein
MILLARRLRDTNDALAATSFLPVKGRVARRCSTSAEASVATSAAGVSSCGRRSRKSEPRAMAVLPAKMSAAS